MRQNCSGKKCRNGPTCIARHEKSAKGFKAAKDRITLLLTCNALGTCKMKPLVIHRAKKPRPYCNYDMTRLNVHWLHNKKAWMSSALFLEWFDSFFVPDAKRFCSIKKIPFRVLLLLDNAPGHPKTLVGRYPNVNVVFMPPNTTSLLQPMDQEIIANVKAAYACKTFTLLDKATSSIEEDIEVILAQASTSTHAAPPLPAQPRISTHTPSLPDLPVPTHTHTTPPPAPPTTHTDSDPDDRQNLPPLHLY